MLVKCRSIIVDGGPALNTILPMHRVGREGGGVYLADKRAGRWPNDGLMLVHRLRRWLNIITSLGQRLLSASDISL